ncbi:MAG: hypothetical protein FD165_1958 [Gammaproteobacteria bacterium]|nr:MAG: hypothetical protein FD165_1958 [Gammaproteobacteria bacterium]TND04952.1 MAG: hypothetical protein FD120_1230 [Gammaproteobacteria bacterium]
MGILIVVNSPKDWPIASGQAQVISAKSYLTNPAYTNMRGVKVFNLTRSYRYQSMGYYVSLLAEARGHKPLPSINTIQDMKSQTIIRFVSDDLNQLIQKSLAPIQSKEFVLSIYFGRNLAKRYDRLSLNLFNLFPAPLLRARFVRGREWQLQNISPISSNGIPAEHWPFVLDMAAQHFAGKRFRARKRSETRYDLAILHNPKELHAPSDERALKKFVKAAESLGIAADLITKDDYGTLAEYDALFIRETTLVNHHTYRFARRATAEGMVVVDDPDSILKCTNKVYLAELMTQHDIPIPKTWIISKESLPKITGEISMPCVLKQPDSAFSQGVIKVHDMESFISETKRLLDKSDLIIGQEYLPTDFDWRVGIFDRRPLYVCKYFMARQHWQIVEHDEHGKSHEGRAETFTVEEAPPKLIRIALRAANLIGDGLYGVDIKQVGKKYYVIEVNDNPSIDATAEDRVLGNQLYTDIMSVFLKRIEQRKGGRRDAD